MRKLREHDLHDFVAEVDRTGGPSAADFWTRYREVRYQPTNSVDENLDPYGAEYSSRMLALHKEIFGKEYNAPLNELTDFDLDAHLEAATAYGPNVPASQVALHMQRLASAVRHSQVASGGKVLDMGCGWGLSSEFLAQCGYAVTAVDINPKFVQLVNGRAERNNYNIKAIAASFDQFKPDEEYDAVLFYECLHHATRPWELIEGLARNLKPHGKIVLAGEPIQSEFWRHWGLRLDPLSIYCIRKFGWFESGWSLTFLKDMFARAGLITKVRTDADADIGYSICAEIPSELLRAPELLACASDTGWQLEQDSLICVGQASLKLPIPSNATTALVTLDNFRGKTVRIDLGDGSVPLLEIDLQPGRNVLTVPLPLSSRILSFSGKTWSPAEELGSADTRQIIFHLVSVGFSSEENLRSETRQTAPNRLEFLKRIAKSIRIQLNS